MGGSHNRQQSRQVNTQQYDGPITRGYIKNVHEGIDTDALKAALEQYGEVVYYDINRLKVRTVLHEVSYLLWITILIC